MLDSPGTFLHSAGSPDFFQRMKSTITYVITDQEEPDISTRLF